MGGEGWKGRAEGREKEESSVPTLLTDEGAVTETSQSELRREVLIRA